MLPFPDERQSPRQSVELDATVRELRSVATRCQVTDLTQYGCRLSGCDLNRGDELWIHIDGHEAVRATTIWAQRGEAGCRFYATPVRLRPAQPSIRLSRIQTLKRSRA